MIFQSGLKSYFNSFYLVCKTDGLAPASIADYKKKLGIFSRFLTGSGIDDPKNIGAMHIRLFLEERRSTCNSVSVSGYYRSIKRFFNWMVEEELLPKSPMDKIKPPRVERKVIRPFTIEEINKLLMLCDQKTFLGLRNRAIILTFFDTGLRLREMADIQLKDIDLDREVIKVMGKGARERFVRIGGETQKSIVKYLLARRDNYPCLWVSEERKPLLYWGIEIMIRKLGKRAALAGVRCSPHTFRHSFGTSALRNHADIREVQVLLGHATLNMTLRYVATIASEDAIQGHRGNKERRGFSPVDNMKLG
jgi:integrase/recombinase XerC/integrase/recombinase XerD